MRFVLASASPARLKVLRAAGVESEVVVSGVDEDQITAERPAEHVLLLAQAKARAVAGTLDGAPLVLGCDSMLELDGVALGKPHDAAHARERWAQMAGRDGVLHTGHWLVRGTREVGRTASTTVRFGAPSDEELAAYIDTGEPLAVAGGFTIDGRGSWWVNSIHGDPGTVIGLSLPLLRSLLAELDVRPTDLW